jgi:DNA-binding NarL/FixJ family response regulator
MRALVAEGDGWTRRTVRWLLEDDGFIVDSVHNDADLITLAARADVVVVDIGMLGSGDVTALEELHAARLDTPVVAFSSAIWPELRVAAEMLGATSFVPAKPTHPSYEARSAWPCRAGGEPCRVRALTAQGITARVRRPQRNRRPNSDHFVAITQCP